MANVPSIGGGGTGGIGALPLAKKKDGTDAIFATSSARDTYYNANPDMLAKLESGREGVGIGTVDKISAAYMRRDKQWVAIATNFKGDDGAPGKPGAGVDLSGFKDREIPIVDHSTNSLVESGVFAGNGEIDVEPDSVIIGAHELSSSAENLTVTNLATSKVYAPLWQEVAPGADTAFIRAHSSILDDIVISSTTTRNYDNPTFDFKSDVDQTIFGMGWCYHQPLISCI